jgi:NAD(P)-dependent dehydrogenase (short-subunit alcohol dehydrogenase family)
MNNAFKGKVALITGGSSGIGRATALAFAHEGAQVVIGDVNRAGSEETVRMITAAGGEAFFVRTDVTQAAEVAALVAATVERYGRLDCAFNNAGIESSSVSTADYPEEDWRRIIDINLTGVWLSMKHELPQMLKQGGGVIVNNASALGLVAFAGASAYVAAKHGVVGLTKTTALEYAKSGIRVNAICPGFIETPMLERIGLLSDPKTKQAITNLHPMQRMGAAAEMAAAVIWLCSDAASFVTGIALPADGGYTAR